MPEKTRVLFIEDEPADAALLVRALKQNGFDFEWARVDTEVEYLRQLETPPDVILSDFDLPEFDVFRALDILQQRGLDIPFILVTGRLGEDLAVEVIQRGASDYLLKDRLARLGEAVRRAIEQCRLRREKTWAIEALRRSEQRYRRLVDSNVVGIVVTDGHRILEVNDYLLGILGYSREEFESGAIGWRDITSPNHRSISLRSLRQFIRTGTFPAFEDEYLAKNGKRVPLFIGSVALGRVANGKRARRQFLSFVVDLTERKQIEEQFRQAQKLETFGQLAGGIAHDFNNLLTVISGYSSMMLDKMPPEHSLRGDLEEIAEAARRSSELTRQLLTFSRRELSEPKNIVLNQVVRKTEKMLKRLIGEDIDLKLLLSREESVICADPGQVEQVIVNLAVNARDAMPRGGTLLIQTVATPGKSAALLVHDTGEGMTAEVQARLFEPFFTTKGPGKGTGLGLSTVYGIVTKSGGTISVASELGHGSVFEVVFPATVAAAEATAAPIPRAVQKGIETILVAEDEKLLLNYVRQVLEKSGYTVLEARTGRVVLEVARRHPRPIHLFLSDVVMPEVGDTDLAVQFLAIRPGVPVLRMSGYIDRIGHGGVVGEAFIQKPFSGTDLLRKVRSLLDASRQSLKTRDAVADNSN